MRNFIISVLSACFLASCIIANAQNTSHLEVFTENGESFILTVNGVRMNQEPQSNVKATGLTGEYQRVGVQFSDLSLGTVSQNVMTVPGTAQRAVVKLIKKGYVLRPFGEPIALASEIQTPTVTVIESSPLQSSPTHRNENIKTVESTPDPNLVLTTVTTSSTARSADENLKMDIVTRDVKVGIDVRVIDGEEGTATMVHTNEPTNNVQRCQSTEVLTAQSEPTPVATPVDDCSAMAAAEFSNLKSSLASKNFEDSKTTTAKQVLRNTCMSASQIVEIVNLLTYEESKLDFAKAAYTRCSDPQNYWKLNDAFTFETSIDELNEFLETK